VQLEAQRQFAVSYRLPCALRAPVCHVFILCREPFDFCRELAVDVCLSFAVSLPLPCAERKQFAVCFFDAVCMTSQVGSKSAARRAQATDAWHICRVLAHVRGHLVPLPCASTRQNPSFFAFYSVFA
jgi:hypothetical protein